jgi:hypothetical protein
MPTNKNFLAGAALLVGPTLLRIKGRFAWLLRLSGLGVLGAGLAAQRSAAPSAADSAASPPEPAAQQPEPVPVPEPVPTPAAEPEPAPRDDALVAAEEAAAAAEASAIGGPRLDDAHGDPALEPVYEAGGGDAEGFELAEAELIENASHGEGRADPLFDAPTPEVEADRATAVDGEPDELVHEDAED